MREEIIVLGGEVRFESRLTDLLIENGRVKGVVLANGETLLTRHVVLAPGHSSRDTFRMLHQRGVEVPSRVVPGLEGSVVFEWQFPDGGHGEIEVVRPFLAEVMLLEPGKPARHWTLPDG